MIDRKVGAAVYFVDRQKIEAMLVYMENKLSFFEHHENWTSETDQLALERLAHVLIESVIDVGNQMIDGFIMRDPGSYADIIDILNDEKVISDEEARDLRAVIEMRKSIVRSFRFVDHNQLVTSLEGQLPSLRRFPAQVRRYLNDELGPVSAFLSEKDQENPS